MDAPDRHLTLLDPDGHEVGRLTPELAALLGSDPPAAATALALAGVDPAAIALLIARSDQAH